MLLSYTLGYRTEGDEPSSTLTVLEVRMWKWRTLSTSSLVIKIHRIWVLHRFDALKQGVHYYWSICRETNPYLYKRANKKPKLFWMVFFSDMSRNKRFYGKFKMFIPLIVYFKTFSMYEYVFFSLKNHSWRMIWTKNSEKISRCSCQWDLPIDSCFLQFALPGMTKSPVWTHFQMYAITFFSLSAMFLENGMSEKFCKKFQLFLSVKPIIWAIIRRNLLLGTLRIAYCTTSKFLKSRFFHFKPRCWRRIWTKNSEKNCWCFS